MNAFEYSLYRVSEVRRIELAHEQASKWTDEWQRECPCCGYEGCFWKREEIEHGR